MNTRRTQLQMRNPGEAKQVPDPKALQCTVAGAGKNPQTPQTFASLFKSFGFS